MESNSHPQEGSACSGPAERMLNAWEHFVGLTKYQSRFFFHELAEHANDSPQKILKTARAAFEKLTMFKSFPVGYCFYRARHYDGSWPINEPKELLAPPREKARAGRMNPAGIRYLYLAEEQETALVEVRPSPGSDVVVAQFELTKELRILDLAALDNVTDDQLGDDISGGIKKGDLIPFLRAFVSAISLPVIQDGREHIDYVPSQVVCEYFAQAHMFFEPIIPGGKPFRFQRIHGIRYRSALHGNGFNIVLFPQLPSDEDGGFEKWVERTEAPLAFHSFASWADVGRLILGVKQK